MSNSTITIKNETANRYGGVHFNNSPDATSNGLVFPNIDWASGTLIKDEWSKVLDQDIEQDGYTYSVRAKYDPTPSSSWSNLYDIAFQINGEIVLEWSSTYWAVYLNNEETQFNTGMWDDDTYRLLGGDETLQFLLTGDNTQIFEAIFSHDITFRMGDGNDVIYGYDGNDIIYGNGGNDKIVGGNGHDTVYAGDGDDIIVVGGGTYFDGTVDAGNGNDTVFSHYSWGIEILLGSGNDHVINTRGNVFGGDGNDTVIHWRDSKNYALSKSPVSDTVTITYYWGS